MFSNQTADKLIEMRMVPSEYYNFFYDKFGKNDKIIRLVDSLISTHHDVTHNPKDTFNEFCEKHEIKGDSDFYPYLYEVLNNLSVFNQDGLFALFKFRNPEWGTPRVTLNEQDITTNSDTGSLDEVVTIYRGMSIKEYETKNFSQHWTSSFEDAKRFACDTYSDEPNGIIVEAKIKKEDILYCDKNDSEKELIPKTPVSAKVYDLIKISTNCN